MEDMVNVGTATMATHSAASDYLVGMACTVTVDMATITEAVTLDIILIVISMGDMVATLKDINSISHTHNIKLMDNLKLMNSPKHMLNLQPIVSLQPILSLQPIVNLKLTPNRRPIL